eukprot:COSAG02_NODE_1142_length_14267_cov_4.941700_2_plen_72_part_00
MHSDTSSLGSALQDYAGGASAAGAAAVAVVPTAAVNRSAAARQQGRLRNGGTAPRHLLGGCTRTRAVHHGP